MYEYKISLVCPLWLYARVGGFRVKTYREELKKKRIIASSQEEAFKILKATWKPQQSYCGTTSLHTTKYRVQRITKEADKILTRV